MQVFVPYPDIKKSVQCLDNTRLGNQIYRECLTIAKGRWPNHPATKMWWNHTYFLCEYAFAGLEELSYRGKHYPNSFDRFHDIQMSVEDTGPPIWWGDDKVHTSHASALLYKDPDHYRQYFDNLPKIDYYWPSYSQEEIWQHGNKYRIENDLPSLLSKSYCKQ